MALEIKKKKSSKEKRVRNTAPPRLVSLCKGARSDQGGKTKWIMGKGKISLSNKLIVLPFSTVCPVLQETNKGKPGVLHSNTHHHITRHY